MYQFSTCIMQSLLTCKPRRRKGFRDLVASSSSRTIVSIEQARSVVNNHDFGLANMASGCCVHLSCTTHSKRHGKPFVPTKDRSSRRIVGACIVCEEVSLQYAFRHEEACHDLPFVPRFMTLIRCMTQSRQ